MKGLLTRTNQFLATTISRLNAILAWILLIGLSLSFIIGGAAMGPAGALFGMLVGPVVGFISAVLICGTLSILIDMRNALRQIANQQIKTNLP